MIVLIVGVIVVALIVAEGFAVMHPPKKLEPPRTIISNEEEDHLLYSLPSQWEDPPHRPELLP